MTTNVLKRRTCASVAVIFSHAIAAVFQIAIAFEIYAHDRRANSDSQETPSPRPSSGHVSSIAAIGSIVHVITLSVFHLWNEILAVQLYYNLSRFAKWAITAVLALITLGSSLSFNIVVIVTVGFEFSSTTASLALFSLIFGNIAVIFKIIHGYYYSF